MTQPELDFSRPQEGVVCVAPTEDTQCGKLLRAFQRGERLTIWEAMFKYGVGGLHQRVRDLKKLGWPVQREEVVKNKKRVAEFWMEMA